MTRFSLSIPPFDDAVPAGVDMGDTPGSGRAITLTNRFVERDGRPWIPVMGEYHYARDDAASWERELRKMKAGGVNVVAAYSIWILHEEIRGERNWSGNRDLRAFVELAASVGLLVVARIGPWVHGETRNGGFPDWLQELPIAHRTNDPDYLDLVRGWYGDIATQLDGLVHSIDLPDAPVIGIQVDNELYDQPDHLDTLRSIAEDAGLLPSLWIATGWGGADLPADRVMPVYAGYSDGFWEEADVLWPSFGRLHFTFSSERDDLSVGADLRATAAVASERDYRYPYVTCELGGGMQAAYHRRPLVDPADVAALALTKLGSGSAWQGYYLYHGATQQPGALSGTQESHSTGYPNDMPLLDYDFFAPVGAHGQLRGHYHLLRLQHLFLEQYGHTLAGYPATIPAVLPGGPRWSVRGGSDRGYLFVNNHQPAAEPLPALAGVQFAVEFARGTTGLPATVLPAAPITVPADSFFVWPLRQQYGDIPHLTGTVQPITELDGPTGTVVVFAASEGIAVELQLEGVDRGLLDNGGAGVGGASVEATAAGLLLRPLGEPGPDCVITVGTTTLVILDPASAARLWRGDVGGVDTLLLWEEGLLFDRGLELLTARPDSELLAWPALADPAGALADLGPGTLFHRYHLAGPRPSANPAVSALREAAGRAPVRTGGSADRLSAPVDGDYFHAAVFRIDVDTTGLDAADQWLLRLDWAGDVGRVRIGGQVVSDQFWSGRAWDIDLGPHRGQLGEGILVEVLPWHPDSRVFVDPRVRPTSPAPVAAIRSATVVSTRAVRAAASGPR